MARESYERGWTFAKEVVALARANKKLLVPGFLHLFALAGYVTGIVCLYTYATPRVSIGWHIAIGFGWLWGWFFLGHFFRAMTVNMVDAQLRGETPSLWVAAKDALANGIALGVLALMSLLFDSISAAIRDGDGIISTVIAGFIDMVWTTLSSLLLPAIIIEDIGVIDALRRVRTVYKGQVGLIAIGEVGVTAVSTMLTMAPLVIGGGLVYLLRALGAGQTMLGVVAVIAFATVAAAIALTTYIRMAYYTCLYRWALDRERKGDSAGAPLPLALALGPRYFPRRVSA